MGHGEQPVNGFDKQALAQLLMKCKGSDSQIEFAEKTGVCRSVISKYLNAKSDSPPTISTLKKLARNGVSVSDLAWACGNEEDRGRSADIARCKDCIRDVLYAKGWQEYKNGKNWLLMINEQGENWLFDTEMRLGVVSRMMIQNELIKRYQKNEKRGYDV